MPPRKQRSGRAKPGLHLVNESPARPLSTFQGFQRKVFDADEQMNPKESSIQDPDTSEDLNGKSKSAPLLTPPSTLWVDNKLITKVCFFRILKIILLKCYIRRRKASPSTKKRLNKWKNGCMMHSMARRVSRSTGYEEKLSFESCA